MSVATAFGHPTFPRLYVSPNSPVGTWLRNFYSHAPFGRASGNPNSTSIELSKSQRKLYRKTFLGDLWMGKVRYRVAQLDREGLTPLVEFDLTDKRLKAPKLHVSHLIGETETHARTVHQMFIAEAGETETLN